MAFPEMTDARSVVARFSDLYPPEEATCSLSYRRALGVVRLAKVVEETLATDSDLALLIAARLLAPAASA